ncbi:class I SAM-dependent methyltransferase [Geofilum rhodophaeum]|uniref:class I SAM-dependent methyltransferase n=1 Tax=Geofilum rhodophaeum TaxID=1965019 RepID=UPI000B525E46|nr:class I SAM-dependent methyltransferase [Geofilum rhodophaeum]
MAFYESIAPWYDHIFPPAPAQLNFTESICGPLKDKKILDIGCGTGNLSLLLSAAGAEVCGLDLDPEMIARARKKVSSGKEIDFRVGNMLELEQLELPFRPEAVVCFGNTLVHLHQDHELTSFFQQVHRLLPRGAYLLLQLIHYNHILDHQVNSLPSIDNEHLLFDRRYRLMDNGLLAFDTTLHVKSENREIQNSVTLNPLRKEHLEKLLRENGFGNLQFFGDFKGGPLLANSTPLVLAAQKI